MSAMLPAGRGFARKQSLITSMRGWMQPNQLSCQRNFNIWGITRASSDPGPGHSADFGISPNSDGKHAEAEPEGTQDVDQAERKKKLVRDALKQGTLGMGFSAGGFLYTYHLGVLWELARLKILPSPDSPGAIKMAGASAGSLAIATFACGLDVDKATKAIFEFAADCRKNGTRGRLSPLLRDFLHAYLPDDAPERCRDLTYVAVTRVFPVWRPEVVHRFHDKDDLVQALVTSCHIPFYANGEWMTKFRGRYYMDGGVAAFVPRPPTPTVVKVCCFPVNEVLTQIQPRVENYQRIASLLDVAISPDAYEDWPYTYQQLLNWALVPAEDEVLKSLIEKGRRDAHAWAKSVNLVPQEEEEDGDVSSTTTRDVQGSDKAEQRLQRM